MITNNNVSTIKIKTLEIKKFKSFEHLIIELDTDFNVFTGINNSGKTNLLEAISLWHECFTKLIRQAGRSYKNLYQKGDYLLGNTQEKYFPYETIKTVRSSNIEDIFYQCDTKNSIELITTFTKNDFTEAISSLEIGFSLKTSGMNYVIELINYNDYDFKKFNEFFNNFPEPVNASFASPVAAIREYEKFVTRPQIIEAIQKRASVDVIRNRLYSLYQSTGLDSSLYDRFIQDLSYILFDNLKKIEFFIKSDIRQDTKAIIDFKIENKDIEKDISLLGSGTLQIILILLNLYAPEQERDLNLILFDEPDSHIHRDIQQRLIEIITKFSNQTQIFLTTHNETLIRQIPLHQLFHLENKPKYTYKAIAHQQEIDISSRFKGIYPSVTNPIISSLGSSNGLDFINAIEANRIIFVEGQDDAKVIDLLLQHRIPKNTNKYVFWVLGGISRIFQDLPAYKKVFQIIKNQQSLWNKSILVFDRDFLNDEYRQNLIDKMNNNFGLESYISNAYTFESILLTDLDKLARLLTKWIQNQDKFLTVNSDNLLNNLQASYTNFDSILEENFIKNSKHIEDVCYQYRDIRKKLQQDDLFGNKNNTISDSDIQLQTKYRNYLNQVKNQKEFYKMTNKKAVENIIISAISPYNLNFDIEENFIDLIKLVDKSIWFSEWDFLTKI